MILAMHKNQQRENWDLLSSFKDLISFMLSNGLSSAETNPQADIKIADYIPDGVEVDGFIGTPLELAEILGDERGGESIKYVSIDELKNILQSARLDKAVDESKINLIEDGELGDKLVIEDDDEPTHFTTSFFNSLAKGR